VTSFGNDFEFQNEFEGVDLSIIPSTKTTHFKNIYNKNIRQQYLLNKASDILSHQLLSNIVHPKMVLLGPIANEIEFDLINKYSNSLVAVCPQGWMRRWDKAGKVYHVEIEDWSVFQNADMVVLSEEDLNFDLKKIPYLASLFEILVVTKSEKGADVFFQNKKYSCSGFEVNMIDPTGAGDIFATAFLIKYYQTKDILHAANFANAAAAFCIEGKGMENLPTEKTINNRISKKS